MITAELLVNVTGCTQSVADRYAPHLADACAAYDIVGPERVAAFLAQIGHESAGLSRVVENLNYSTEALLKMFGRHRISQGDAYRFGRRPGRPANQQAIANILYGGEWGKLNLGNTEPGDGWKYRGRSLIQTTGRSNYERLTRSLRQKYPTCPDFVATPDALQLDKWASWAPADFWHRIGGNTYADSGDFQGLTRRINGGMIGMDDRNRRLATAKNELGSVA